MSFTVRRLQEGKASSRFPWKRVFIAALWMGRPILSAFKRAKKRKEEREERSRNVMVLKRAGLMLVAVSCVFLLVTGAAAALVKLRVLNVRQLVNVASSELPKDQYGHINLLLLGQGDEGHDGVDLTDTLIIASIDPGESKSAAMLSLPRDLYFLKTEKMGKGRINSLYRDYKYVLTARENLPEAEASRKAMRALADEIGFALGMTIHHVIKVDFEGFVQAVDAVEGIDLVVPEAIVDREYPGLNYTYQTFAIDAGMQHLDGETALKYARSRHTTSDFSRSARQQQILRSLSEKVRAQGLLGSPDKLLSLIGILQEHLETTLNLREMAGLAEVAMDLDQQRILTMQIHSNNGLYNTLPEAGGFLYAPPREDFQGASVLLPVSIPPFPVTWKQLEAFTTLFFHKRTAYVSPVPIAVLNAGSPSGNARKLANELIRYGFLVETVENADLPALPTSSISVKEGVGARADDLATLLNIPPGPLPAELPLEQQLPITIILGKDFTYTPFQSLLTTEL